MDHGALLREENSPEGMRIFKHLISSNLNMQYLLPLEHVHLCACCSVCVEHLHLFVEQSLCAIQFDFFFLKLHNLVLQFLHIGTLNCTLQLMFLKRKTYTKSIATREQKQKPYQNFKYHLYSTINQQKLDKKLLLTHRFSQFTLQLLKSARWTLQPLQLCSDVPQF